MPESILVPHSLPDFYARFGYEQACVDYLKKLRWPRGYRCDHCNHNKGRWIITRRRMDCARCGKGSYLTAGTIMHRSHTPLRTWFAGAFIIGSLTPGISSVQFQKMLGLSRHETAFQILHKLRAAMVNRDRAKLKGTIEVDETFLGGLREGARGGRSVEYKCAVIGGVEVRQSHRTGGEYAGRVRFRVIPDTTADSLNDFIREHVERGANVVTDAYSGYSRLRSMGYEHESNIFGEARQGAEKMRLIHLEISNLKTFIRGTYHGRVERQHVQAYLNEFCFRHNRRFFDAGMGFLRLLQIGSAHRSPTYDELYEADELGRNVHLNGLGPQRSPRQIALPIPGETRRARRRRLRRRGQ